MKIELDKDEKLLLIGSAVALYIVVFIFAFHFVGLI